MRPYALNSRAHATRGHTFVEMMIVLCTMTP
jgi:competence protein ComGC